jgi:protein gp37
MASLADFFDNEADPAWRESAWALVLKCKSLDWLIVTKRIGNVEDMLPEWWTPERFPHVTLIASIGVQAEVLRDGPKLIRAKEELGFARVGISAEPLLERLDLSPLIFEPVCCERPVVSHPDDGPECCGSPKAGPTGKIDWVICGGESGPRRRPFEIEWAEELALQCAHGEVPFFFKQDSALKPGKRGRASKELWAKKEFPTFWTEPERDDPDPDYLREDREEARRLERW